VAPALIGIKIAAMEAARAIDLNQAENAGG
jgi:hypothetical protein